ncbi:MAG: SDR family NAD(P)-dependent oxidoreductase [Bacteroidia bacterium]|nr:SDR family NAD(P)-dependent oxidoreductase [Bacteroidia bacterium]MCZ2248846.1 SDR family NAD(P)-dependent oxidoreductase [Bacteroidia bacterium]
MDLLNKSAVVTGASKGLGQAIASALCTHGVKVYGIGRDIQKLNQLKTSLGHLFVPVQLDITKQEEIVNWANQTFTNNIGPDILINNAGTGSFHSIEHTETATWHKIMDTNVNGMYYITRAMVGFMKQKNTYCHIINIGSIMGKVGKADSTAYSASKFAVQGFSESLFLELRYNKIKVTCVNPGSIQTDFFDNTGIQSHKNMLQPNEVADTIIHILKTPDNVLISEITLRPLNPTYTT